MFPLSPQPQITPVPALGSYYVVNCDRQHGVQSWSPSATDTEIGSMGKGEESIKFDAFGKFLNSSLGATANSYTQFICYLNAITKMEDLNYYFDAKLLSSKGVDPEQYVKDKFKILFTDPNKKTEIFNVLWNNSSLKSILFNGLIETDVKDKYDILVSDQNSALYSIIKVK